APIPIAPGTAINKEHYRQRSPRPARSVDIEPMPCRRTIGKVPGNAAGLDVLGQEGVDHAEQRVSHECLSEGASQATRKRPELFRVPCLQTHRLGNVVTLVMRHIMTLTFT